MVKRFEEIIKRIPECDTMLDVGCDHGYISYEALNRGIAKKVVCSDISAPSLKKAQNLIGERGSYYVADGIPKNVEFDFLVIAGMGGREIMKILEDRKPMRALLQPMKNIDSLREFLVRNGYKIKSDEIIFDGKYYNIIVTDIGFDTLSEDEIVFGRTNLQNLSEDFMSYLENELDKTKEIIIKATGKRKAELYDYIKKIEAIKRRKQNDN